MSDEIDYLDYNLVINNLSGRFLLIVSSLIDFGNDFRLNLKYVA